MFKSHLASKVGEEETDSELLLFSSRPSMLIKVFTSRFTSEAALLDSRNSWDLLFVIVDLSSYVILTKLNLFIYNILPIFKFNMRQSNNCQTSVSNKYISSN